MLKVDDLNLGIDMKRVEQCTRYYLEMLDSEDLDLGVFDAVVMLNSVGVCTYVSCEGWNPGHRGYDANPEFRDVSPPMIQVCSGVYSRIADFDFLSAEESYDVVEKLLEEFYLEREVDVRYRLGLSELYGDFFNLSFFGLESLMNCSIEDHKACLKEVMDFADFVREKYFSGI